MDHWCGYLGKTAHYATGGATPIPIGDSFRPIANPHLFRHSQSQAEPLLPPFIFASRNVVGRAMFIMLLCFAASASHAGPAACPKLAARIDGPENNYRPPLEVMVTGNGRLYFHTAPSARCRKQGVFVIKGEVMPMYKSFDGWAQVMVIAKNGDDFTGWVQESRVRKIGQYGRNP